jgi:ABC-type multidrug transport system fused ATPase/permease subunit
VTTTNADLGGLAPILRLVPMLRAERGLFLRTTAATIGYQLVSALSLAAGAALVGHVVSGGGSRTGALVVALLIAVVGVGALHWTEMWLAHVLAYRVLDRIRLEVYDALHRTAPGGLLRRRTGDLAAAAMADVEVLEWFYAHTVAAAVAAIVAPAVLVVLLGLLVGWLALVVALALLTVATVPWLLRRTAERQGEAIRAELGLLKAETLDGVQGLRELLVFGRAGAHRDRIVARSRRLHRGQRAYALRAGAEAAAVEAITAITVLVVVAVCAARVAAGDLDLALYPSAVVLTVGAFAPVAAVFGMLGRLGELSSAAQRVFTVIDAPPNVVETATGGTTVAGCGPAAVTFDGVRFRYGPDLPEVLHGVSFTVEAGTTVALVGESGAGKSTCAHLLLRFWDPTAGRVLLDGVPLTGLGQEYVRELVGLVPQDGYLFHRSIRENVMLARPAATPAELDRAVRAALLDELVAELPAGLDTVVGERGAALSGGQRQRVAIARALLRDPPVLVLDEPVSNVDAESEAGLNAAMAAVRRGRTTIVIAHRLSTIRAADRVVFLQAGVVAATGTHDELAGTCPAYRAVVAQQEPPNPAPSAGLSGDE